MPHKSDVTAGFGERLTHCRKNLQMTRHDLASQLVWHRSTIERYETGQTLPDIRKLAQLAVALDADPAYLAFGKNPPKTKPVLPEPVRKALASFAKIIEDLMQAGWVKG